MFALVVVGALAALLPSAATAQVIIVSAGDSFASGEGAPDGGFHPIWRGDDSDGLNINPAMRKCHRSGLAAAAQAAGQLAVFKEVTFGSVACSGSQTGATKEENDWETDSGDYSLRGVGGQFAKIKSDQRFSGKTIDGLVLSIGGNDIGFLDVVLTCMAPVWPCWADPNLTYGVGKKLADLPRRLDEIIAAIRHGEAGDVRNVFLTEYADFMDGPANVICGVPFITPAFDGFDIDQFEAEWARASVLAPLNAILRDAVSRANSDPNRLTKWHFVSGISERFRSHGYCSGFPSPNPFAWPYQRFVNTLQDSLWIQGDVNGSMHPNVQGQQAIGDALTRSMLFLVKDPPPPPPPPRPPSPLVCSRKPWTPGCDF